MSERNNYINEILLYIRKEGGANKQSILDKFVTFQNLLYIDQEDIDDYISELEDKNFIYCKSINGILFYHAHKVGDKSQTDYLKFINMCGLEYFLSNKEYTQINDINLNKNRARLNKANSKSGFFHYLIAVAFGIIFISILMAGIALIITIIEYVIPALIVIGFVIWVIVYLFYKIKEKFV